MQRDLEKLESWPITNQMKFKYPILHLGRCNPGYRYRLGDEAQESNPAERGLGVLVYNKINMSQQYAQVARKAKHIMGCIKNDITSRSRKLIVPLYIALVQPHLMYCVQWMSQYKKEIKLLTDCAKEVCKDDRRSRGEGI